MRARGDGTTRSAEWSNWSSSYKATNGPPPAPSLGGSVYTDNVILTWVPVDGAVNYKVSYAGERFLESSPGFRAENLKANTTYTFTVKAYGDGARYVAEWGLGDSHTATTGPPPAPSIPEVKEKTETSVTLSFSRILGADGYQVRWRVDEGKWNEEPAFNTSANTIEPTIVFLEGGTYEFQVSFEGDGERYTDEHGEWSGSREVLILKSVDTPDMEISPGAAGQVYLNWETMTGISHFQVDMVRERGDGWGWLYRNVPGTWTGVTVLSNQLECGTLYTFRVYAHGDGKKTKKEWGDPAQKSVRTADCVVQANGTFDEWHHTAKARGYSRHHYIVHYTENVRKHEFTHHSVSITWTNPVQILSATHRNVDLNANTVITHASGIISLYYPVDSHSRVALQASQYTWPKKNSKDGDGLLYDGTTNVVARTEFFFITGNLNIAGNIKGQWFIERYTIW